jgi:hypothetical protein
LCYGGVDDCHERRGKYARNDAGHHVDSEPPEVSFNVIHPLPEHAVNFNLSSSVAQSNCFSGRHHG